MEEEHKKMSQDVMFDEVIVAVLVIVYGLIFCDYMNYGSISLIIGVVVAFIFLPFLEHNAAMKKEAYRQEKEAYRQEKEKEAYRQEKEAYRQEKEVYRQEKEAYRLEKEEQHTASSEFHPHYAEIVTNPVASGMKALDISCKQDEASIELTQDGGRCDISKYGALLEYPRNAVRSPTRVVCKACSRESIPSPEADVMETLVSHLVQLGPSSVELQEPVIVTLLHAGPGKKYGYETIVKAFDDEEGFWKEIEEFKDTSHIPKSYKAENVIQVKISKFTYLAVISRLITDTFEVTPAGCVVRSSVCDDVTITFPEGAVDKTITGSMKLVLLPEMIFLFSGFKDMKFLKQVIVKFPYRGSTDDFPGHLRVMFQKGAVHPKERWNDVTGNITLEKKESGFLEFHVQHFCRLTVSEPTSFWWRSPQNVFLGAFKNNRNSPKLTIACASISTDCENDLIRNGYESLAVSTGAKMRPEQKAYVRLKDGPDIQTEEGVFVKFIEGGKYLQELVYRTDRNYYQNHATSSEEPLWVYLCFYPDTNYIEKERIGSLTIDRRRLYPTEETRYHGEECMDIDPTEESMHVDPEQHMPDVEMEDNQNINSFVTPTCLEEIPQRYHPDSFEFVYKMTNSPRGVSYILNMNSFSVSPFHVMYGKLKDRLGSGSDVVSLSRLFKDLQFKVQPLWDLKKKDLIAEMERITEEDFTSYDCLVVFIMSHGKNNYIYASDGEEVHLKEEIFGMFKNSKCETLKEKPKLFFIQACRESVPDYAAIDSYDPNEEQAENREDDDEATDRPDPNVQTYRTYPEYSDNLYAYSCFEGYESFRSDSEGTYFVYCLVDVFRKNSCKEDVLSMLTMVNDEVSKLECLRGKQMPCPSHTLRKKVYFWPGLFNTS